jgi:hypothetical protein
METNKYSLREINDDMFNIECLFNIPFSKESLDFTMEGYLGKTKETAIIEDNCKVLCKKYKGASIVDISKADIHNSTEIKNIQNAIEKLTGFRQVSIIVKNNITLNAYTVPGSMLVKTSVNKFPNMPTAHGKKYFDESHSYFCLIVLNASMFAELEPDECTAFILHEVGHNFDHTLTYWLFDLYVWACTLPSGPLSVILNVYRTEVRAAVDNVLKLLDYIPILPILSNYGTETIRKFGMLLGPLGAVTNISLIIMNAIDNPTAAILGGTRVHQEVFADSYVNSMGYGDAMIRALNKVDKRDYITNVNPALELWTGAGSAATAILCMFMDPHPENQSRAKHILNDMKELANNKDIPANVRKAIKDDYARQKKAYDDFLEVDKDERNARCTRFARKFKESVFGGRCDFRLVLLKLLGGTSAMHNR